MRSPAGAGLIGAIAPLRPRAGRLRPAGRARLRCRRSRGSTRACWSPRSPIPTDGPSTALVAGGQLVEHRVGARAGRRGRRSTRVVDRSARRSSTTAGASWRPRPGCRRWSRSPGARSGGRRAARRARPGAVDRLQPPLPPREPACAAGCPPGRARARARAPLPARVVAAAERPRRRAARPRAAPRRPGARAHGRRRPPVSARAISHDAAQLELEIEGAGRRDPLRDATARTASGSASASGRRRRSHAARGGLVRGAITRPPARPRPPAGRSRCAASSSAFADGAPRREPRRLLGDAPPTARP